MIDSFLALFGGIVFWFFVGWALYNRNLDKQEKINRNPRQKANLEILAHLLEYVEENPDQRFGQILRNIGVVVDVGVRDSSKPERETPDYYWVRGIHEESQKVLERIGKALHNEFEDVNIIKNDPKGG